MQEQLQHVPILSVLSEITSNSQILDICEQHAFPYLCAALHADVVGLWRDQCVQLCLIGPLSSVHRGDGQQERVIVSNQQLWAVPARGNGFANVKETLLQLQEPLDLLMWFLVKSSCAFLPELLAKKKPNQSLECNVPHADNNCSNVCACQSDRMFV